MMNWLFTTTLVLITLYCGLTWYDYECWVHQSQARRQAWLKFSQPLLGIVLIVHAYVVLAPCLNQTVLSLGVGRAMALLTWLMLVFDWLGHAFYRAESWRVFMMPLAILTLGFSLVFPGNHLLYDMSNPAFIVHVFTALFAYSLFGLGALFAVLLLILDKALHSKQHVGWLTNLPSLLQLEQTMFRLVLAGFTLLTLSLVTGVVFSEYVFGKLAAVTHKTIFGFIAWCIFAALLWGRRRYGWRGKVASRMMLIGFMQLFLAYLGSKAVLELILQRT